MMTNREVSDILRRLADLLNAKEASIALCLIQDTLDDLSWRGLADKGLRIQAIKAAIDQYPGMRLLDAKYMVDGRMASQAALVAQASVVDYNREGDEEEAREWALQDQKSADARALDLAAHPD